MTVWILKPLLVQIAKKHSRSYGPAKPTGCNPWALTQAHHSESCSGDSGAEFADLPPEAYDYSGVPGEDETIAGSPSGGREESPGTAGQGGG